MIGQTISHYKILEKLGEGGMGVGYKSVNWNASSFASDIYLQRWTSSIMMSFSG